MRIDVVTIFPDYLAPARLSLVGQAVESGLIDLAVHDLRDWTHDRHRTVDDTPYGGGAGMVMRPEPWGEALDVLAGPEALLVVPTPAGRRFSQAMAEELATAEQLILACGRYEGIDSRVVAWAASRMRVMEVSLGDYVLNGGEAAALVIIEAVARLMPGVIGNPESLREESHAADHDGLLEGPVYTRPPVWRGLAVPEVLMSGDHGRIATWRRERAVELTAARRPDLLSGRDAAFVVEPATPADAGEILTVQRSAFIAEARTAGTVDIPPLAEGLPEIIAAIRGAQAGRGGQDGASVLLVARQAAGDRRGRVIGAVRGCVDGDDPTGWYVGRLAVAPDVQGRGIGRALMDAVEAAAPAQCTSFRLITGRASEANHRFYRRRGYRVVAEGIDEMGVPIVVLTARRRSGRPGPVA